MKWNHRYWFCVSKQSKITIHFYVTANFISVLHYLKIVILHFCYHTLCVFITLYTRIYNCQQFSFIHFIHIIKTVISYCVLTVKSFGGLIGRSSSWRLMENYDIERLIIFFRTRSIFTGTIIFEDHFCNYF